MVVSRVEERGLAAMACSAAKTKRCEWMFNSVSCSFSCCLVQEQSWRSEERKFFSVSSLTKSPRAKLKRKCVVVNFRSSVRVTSVSRCYILPEQSIYFR